MKSIVNRREKLRANDLPPEIPDTSTFVTKTDKASASKLGLVKIGDNVNISSGGAISVPVGSAETAGVYKVGTGLSVDENGALSASATGGLTVDECWSGGSTDSYATFTTPLTDYTLVLITASLDSVGAEPTHTQDSVLLPVSVLAAENPANFVRLVNGSNVATFSLSKIKGRATSVTGFTVFKVYGIK